MDARRSRSENDFLNVVQHCAAWGVKVLDRLPPKNSIPIEFEIHQQVHNGPWHGIPNRGRIYWPTRSIYWKRGSVRVDWVWPRSLLHELSHTLQQQEPSYIHELRTSMLGFEYHTARYLGLGEEEEWYEWAGFSNRLHDYLQLSTAAAVAEGLLTDKFEPTLKRPSWMPKRRAA